MAQTIDLMGASYPDVPSVVLPKHGGGTAGFFDVSDTTATTSDVASGKLFHAADGSLATGTASGGGGSSAYPWFGNGAEKVGTVVNMTINLQNDTGYDSWTASTTATTLIAASSDPIYTLNTDFADYDYCFVTKGYIEPVYASGTPESYRIYRVVQNHLGFFHGYPSYNTIEDMQNKTPSSTNYHNTTTTFFWMYFYNNAGKITSRNATQCGPCYMSTYPTLSASIANGTITYKLPAFYAKCDSSRFSTTRKAQVDSANTDYFLTVDLYRIPHGRSFFGYWCDYSLDQLNA